MTLSHSHCDKKDPWQQQGGASCSRLLFSAVVFTFLGRGKQVPAWLTQSLKFRMRTIYVCATRSSLVYCTDRPAVYFRAVLIKVQIMCTGNYASFSNVLKQNAGVSVLVTLTT